jgi:hypothetical protein
MKFKELLKRTDESFPMFHALKVGGMELSIQASRTHYSTPRETAPTADPYTAFEMAIFENDEWLNPVHDGRFAPLKDELDEVWESGECGVGGYVPSELVQKIYDLIEGLGK